MTAKAALRNLVNNLSEQEAADADTDRVCVDLTPTPQAVSLTPHYDEGRTPYDLDWMGKNLTERGLPFVPATPTSPASQSPACTRCRRASRVGASLID